MLFFAFCLVFDTENINGFNKVTISGSGNILQDDITKSGLYTSYKWLFLNGDFEKIGDSAFKLCINLESINLTNVKEVDTFAFYRIPIKTICLGNTLTTVNNYAFTSVACTSLTIPKSVVTLNGACFEANTNLITLTFEAINSVFKTIAGGAFARSTSLQSVIDFPDSCVSFGTDVFVDSKITTFNIGPNVKTFSGAFRKCPLISLTISPQNPNFVLEPDYIVYNQDHSNLHFVLRSMETIKLHSDCTAIDPYTFSSSSIKTIEFSANFKTIGLEAFSLTSQLKSISLPDTLSSLGEKCFLSSQLTGEITLPSNLDSFGLSAFSNCLLLTKLTISEANPKFKTIGGLLYNSAVTSLLWCPISLTHLTLPNTVTILEESICASCAIESVNFSTSLETMKSFVFLGCKITELYLPKSLKHIGSETFTGCPINKVELEEDNLLTSIGNGAFSWKTFTEFDLKNNQVLSSFGLYPFKGSKLRSFSFPASFKSMGFESFMDCKNLEFLTFKSQVTIGYDSFKGCSALETISFDMAKISSASFPNSGVKTLIFSSKIQEIGGGAFSYCANLETIQFEGGSELVEIVSLAFSYCPCLVSVHLPPTILRLTASSFGYCSNLLEIIIDRIETTDSSFESIDGVVYSRKLANKTLVAFPSGKREVIVDNGTIVLGSYAFDRCGKLEIVNFNTQLKEISNYCFSNCNSLKLINIPIGVTKIGMNPFEGCVNLEHILFCGDSDKHITYDNQITFPSLTKIIVKSEYTKNSFLDQPVIKSNSINPNNLCPNIPSKLFTQKKRKIKENHLLGIIGGFLFLFKLSN